MLVHLDYLGHNIFHLLSSVETLQQQKLAWFLVAESTGMRKIRPFLGQIAVGKMGGMWDFVTHPLGINSTSMFYDQKEYKLHIISTIFSAFGERFFVMAEKHMARDWGVKVA